MNFDEITNRLDTMTLMQNDKLKTLKNPSAFTQVQISKSSSSLTGKPGKELNKNELSASENDLLSKHIELRKIPLSSSSSSSSVDSITEYRKQFVSESRNNDSVNKKSNSETKSKKEIEAKKNTSIIKISTHSDESIQTDEDVSIKSDPSDNSK